MSKQLKLKFKKILKKAEFVHADLEYHRELLPEAKNKFTDAIGKFIATLSPEEQNILAGLNHEITIQQEERIKEEATKREEEENKEHDEMTYGETEEDSFEDPTAAINEKAPEFKKLFRKIASKTHPDKVRARGASEIEIQSLEALFKKAQVAYSNNNWYVLYSIGLQLEVDIGTPSNAHIEWLEEDIRNAMGKMATQNNLLAWTWYIGDEEAKRRAIQDYFKQVFNFIIPG